LRELLATLPGCDPRALWPVGIEEVYAYLPTFRDSNRDFLSDALPDLRKVEAMLERRNALLYIKLHRHTGTREWASNRRIRPWPTGVDVDAALPHLTGLITDYSSVHYDYIFHKAEGSILYLFDEQEYLSADRTLLYPLEENTAGWRARTFAEFLDLIGSGAALKPHPDVPRVRAKFWGDTKGPASPLIAAHVEGLLSSTAGQTQRNFSPAA
jgi:hypothetical protein